MRLPNGYGSVYKLSGKRRKPFIAVITKKINADLGKQERAVLGYYSKREEGLNALSAYNNNPFDLSKKDYTFQECFELFMQNKYLSKGKKPSPRYKFGLAYCKSILDKPVKAIKTAQLQMIIDSCGLSVSSKKIIRICMNGVFKYAMANDLVDKNYAALITMPEQVKSKLHTPFTAKEIEELWQSIDDKTVRLALVMIYTGMRPGELITIKTCNVHVEERYMVGGIKTTNGKNRIIPIADKVLPFVKEIYNPGKTYLLEEKGRPITYSMFYLDWTAMTEKLSMTHLPHDCRHRNLMKSSVREPDVSRVQIPVQLDFV